MLFKRANFRGKCARLLVGTILAGGIVAPVSAQDAAAPEHIAIDANGVDLIGRTYNLAVTDISIGPAGPDGLAFTRHEVGSSYISDLNYRGWVNISSGSPSIIHITIGKTSERFSQSGSVFTSLNGKGSKLTSPSAGTWIYTTADGVEYTLFRDTVASSPLVSGIRQIKYPAGQIITLTWVQQEFVLLPCTKRPCNYTTRQRLSSITNNSGYQLKLGYASNAASNMASWLTLTQVQAINNRIDPCLPTADSCTGLTQSWPVATYSQASSGGVSTTTVVNDRGETWRYTKASGSIGIKRPSATSDTTVITLGASGPTSVNNEGVITSYSFVDAGDVRTATVTAPDLSQTIVKSSVSKSLLSSETDPLGQTTSYGYDTSGRLTGITRPEGDKTVLAYDARGNITSVTSKAKTGSTLTDIVTTASYPASCTNPLTCNLPSWTKDANGKQTDYTYDPSHGGVVTVTEPADSGGIRPQTRYGYTLTGGVSRLTSVSACLSSASCVGTASEARTTIGYDTNSLPNLITQKAGDNSISSATAITYDPIGNIKSVDGPLTGTDDTTTYRYGPGRRVSGIIAPDPDGTGVRKPSAQRISYNSDGEIILTETGIVDNATDTAWSGFSSQEQVVLSYDADNRVIKSELKSGGTAYAVTQTSYDALGRVDCTAQRMNPDAYGALPTSACTLGSVGANGPDRITRTGYNASGQIVTMQTAYGVSGQQADVVTTNYTNNGRTDYVIDAENNRTEYTYDGHDRLVKTEFPSATKGSNSVNVSDYEQYGYDENGNVTSRRLRDGTSIIYEYDNLDRLILKNLPGAELDITYAYDLQGRAKTVIQGAKTFSFTHDALGRNLTQVSPQGTITFGYDAAGRRTSMAYPGSVLTINTDYDAVGNVLKIRENGATTGVGVLANYSYDNLGRQTSVTFGNGSVQSFGYDAISRLQTLTNNLGGAATAHDLQQNFTHNPAHQIASVQRSNDAYAWQAHYNVDRTYGIDGRNLIANAGSALFTYDGRGNLTSDGMNSFSYTAENLLKTTPGATLGYDPLGRLSETVESLVTTRFLYDGIDLIAEYDGSNVVLDRYVHGPGIDNPIVWYDGNAVSNSTRRFLMGDERGSVISITDSAGATVNINAYDEYGIPAPGNVGRFGYTGQVWLSEAGMWYYKARVYSPTLGRFLQTDPIGYADGMNWYNYVGSDPVNFADPWGLKDEPIIVIANCSKGKCGTPVKIRWYFTRDRASGRGGSGKGGGNKPSTPAPQNNPCDAPLSSGVGSARAVLETVALGADIATVGLAAGGVTGPIALGAKGFGLLIEGGIGLVNFYDGAANGNWEPLSAQGASLGARVIPGGRALQGGLKAFRGPTGVLRNSRGQFRSSRLNNPGIEQAGQTATERGAGALVEGAICR